MDPVPTQYIDREGAALAYQVVGDGPVDIVTFNEIVMHVDLAWTDPDMHRNIERAASFSRAVFFQRRGFGLSDQISYTPTVEQQADDVLAVMDAVGVLRATLVGILGTCSPLALVAARAPERVHGLVLLNPLAQGPRSSEELHGWTEREATAFVDGCLHACENWGSGEFIGVWDPAQATPFNRRLVALLERCSATPTVASSYLEWISNLIFRTFCDRYRFRPGCFTTLRTPCRKPQSGTRRISFPTPHFMSCQPPCPGPPSARPSCRLPNTSKRWPRGVTTQPKPTGSSAQYFSPTWSRRPNCSRASGTLRTGIRERIMNVWSGLPWRPPAVG